MNYYPLIAMNKAGTDMVQFSLEDGICPITADLFILTNRSGSPILRYDTILRGMDIPNIYEGDIITYKQRDYIVKYQRGFNAISIDGQVINLQWVKDIKVKTHMYFQDIFKRIELTKIRYRCGDFYFTIRKIYGATKTHLIVNDRNKKFLPLTEIQQDAGISMCNKRLYYGNNADVNVCLHKGHMKIINNYKGE